MGLIIIDDASLSERFRVASAKNGAIYHGSLEYNCQLKFY